VNKWGRKKPMRILIAVNSCVPDVLKGHNQAIRETWASSLPATVDVRFFIGVGKPGPVEAEEPNWQKDFRNLHNRKPHMIRPEPTVVPPLFPDEIALDVPDTYPYLSHKTRAKIKWGVEREYDVIFRSDTDTYIRVPRLFTSGFEQYDYVGEGSDLSGGLPGYAFGGTGVWLSRRCCELLQDAPLTCLADDVWIADVLKPHGITVKHMPNFAYDLNALHPNNIVTVHLGGWTGSYNNQEMFKAHKKLG
jgi:hypothetical protein